MLERYLHFATKKQSYLFHCSPHLYISLGALSK